MSTVVSISSKSGSVAITDEQIGSLVDSMPGLKLDGSMLLWTKRNGYEIHFNIEPNELWSDAINSEEDYELVERIADHLGFKIFIEGEMVGDCKAGDESKQGCGAACLMGALLLLAVICQLVTMQG